MPLVLLVATDRPSVRKFVEQVVCDLYPGARVDFAARGEELERRMATRDFDLILLDMNLPGLDAVQSPPRPLETPPKPENTARLPALAPGSESVQCMTGRAWHPTPGTRPPRSLTPRQWEILLALKQGQSNKEIARHLGILESTVKVHLKTIFRQIDVKNRTQAAIYATRYAPPRNQRPERELASFSDRWHALIREQTAAGRPSGWVVPRPWPLSAGTAAE